MKNETKKLLIGLGIGCAVGSLGLLLGIGVYGCASKPVTTTPIVRNIKMQQQPKNAYPDSPEQDYGEYGSNDYFLSDGIEEYSIWFASNGSLISWASSGAATTLLRWGSYSDLSYTPIGSEVVAGWYYFEAPANENYEPRIFTCDKMDDVVAALRASPSSGQVSDLGSWVVYHGGSGYIYIPETRYIMASSLSSLHRVSLTHSSSWETINELVLPDNWSPLNMVAQNVNSAGNLIYDTDWLYWSGVPVSNEDVPYLKLDGMFFRNQGRLYNRFLVQFQNLNGKQYTSDGTNVATGTRSEWYASEVDYQLVDDSGNVLYSYVAAYPRYVTASNSDVLALGLRWVVPAAQSLQVLVENRYTYPYEWGSYRFPVAGTPQRDPVTGEIVPPIGYYYNDYEFLVAYSNVASVPVYTLSVGGDVFTLITSAFTATLPILNIAVLPNITFGLLLFIPIIAGIIVVIIRIVKK